MKTIVDKFMRYLAVERNSSEHTRTSYKTDIDQFIDFLNTSESSDSKSPDINSVSRLDIRLWLGELSDSGLARNTIARKVASLRSFFKYSFKRGYIEKNPAHLLLVPKKETRLPKTVSSEGINRMMEIADGNDPEDHQNRAILELFFGTGIRLSELVQLSLKDLNLKQNQVLIQGKGNKQRIVPLGEHALESVKQHLTSRSELYGNRTDSDARCALFIAPGGQRVYPRFIQRLVKN